MGKVQNNTGEDRVIPSLGGRYVKAGQVFEVPDDQVYGLTQGEGWDAYDDDAKAAHESSHRAYLARRSEELGGVPVDDNGAPLPPAELVEPAGNASRDDWVDYVVRAGLATEDDLEGKGRDEIRDAYAAPDSDDPDPDGSGDDSTDTDGSN